MSVPLDVIVPVAGMSPEIGVMVRQLEDVRAQTIAVISDLSREELAHRFALSAHQIGGLALHIGENEFWWIESIFAQKELTPADEQFAHLNKTTEEDFALKGYTAQDCIDLLAKIHERTTATLSGYKDETIDEVITVGSDPVRFRGSLRWILHHLIDHEAHHKGQMSMVKRLIRETA